MTKYAAMLAGLGLFFLIGGTAAFVFFVGGSEAARCGITTALPGRVDGTFELQSTTGERVTQADVIDKPSLVYFGYTFCPDVCPFDMARNALAVDLLAESGLEFGLVFITIDPLRDTTDSLASYAADLYPQMTALTGTEAEIRNAAAAFRVQYGKGAGEGDYYLMDHSTFTYLMLPGRGFAGYFRREDSAETIAEKSACLINSF